MPLNPKALQRNFIIVQENQPTSPFQGQIWVRETDGATFQYFNGEWEQIGEEIGGLDSRIRDINESEMDDAVNSERIMDRIIQVEWMLDKVIDSEIGMDKVTDEEMPMEKIMSKANTRDKFYNANHWIDKGILTRSQEVNETVLTESNWTQDLTFNQITDNNANMEEMADSNQSMDDATNSEIAMDKITDKEISMDKIMSKVMPRTKILSSEFTISQLWSKAMPTDKYWDTGTITGNDGDDIRGFEITLDFSNTNTLKLKTSFNYNGTGKIYLDGDELLSFDSGDTWTERSLDVSNYSGELKLRLQYEYFDVIVDIVNGPTGNGNAISFHRDGNTSDPDGDRSLAFTDIKLEE